MRKKIVENLPAAVAALVIGIMIGIVLGGLVMAAAMAEDGMPPVYVTARLLNGRARPSKKASVEARYDRGDSIEQAGRFSEDREWVEVIGGETGTCWVHIRYITERVEPFTVVNENGGKIKIRSKPETGRITGYMKRGRRVTIDRVVMGWGHCSRGWIDLSYVIEEE